MGEGRRKCLFMGCFGVVFCLFLSVDSTAKIPLHRLIDNEAEPPSSSSLQIHVSPANVEIDNGIVKLRLTNPTGQIEGVSYNGVDNVLEPEFKESQRGYWDIVWNRPDIGNSVTDPLKCSSFKIVSQTHDQIEVSFTMKWNSSLGKDVVPLNVDKRYIMLRGVSGFYAYAIFEHLEGWPALNIDRARLAFKLDKNKFLYMAISDERQRIMPTAQDRETGKPLAYKEAVLLTNPHNPTLKGEVDDKYQYSCENKDCHVHGWISSDPRVGFWVITPSDEFRAGGPVKPDLASHTGPVSLSIFFSNHYAGPGFGVFLRDGEPWKKVYGPVLIYLNSDSGSGPTTLWQNAKKQMSAEKNKWPYDFPQSSDFPHPNQRGSIHGRLLVHDSAMKPARSAYVVLAPPGDVGSWQDNFKGYQFWTQTDETGMFMIRGIRAGIYNLYAWVPGIIGDFKHDDNVTIHPGSEIEVGDVVYKPPRNGPTLWEIGIPDRTAAEFYVPDPSPELVNKLYLNISDQKFRQYGLWDRYTDLYPKHDLIYKVGVSNYTKDWFFAHVTRKADNKTYIPTTWRISFDLKEVVKKGNYTLRIALAAAHNSDVRVWINNPERVMPDFSTGKIGRENAIARHGIHGRYWLYNVDVSGSQLLNGSNIIYLNQATAGGPFPGVMYDYIRLEAPPPQHEIIRFRPLFRL